MAKESLRLKAGIPKWKFIYYVFYYIWKGMDGKKTLSGLVLTIGGIVLMFVPSKEAHEKANEFLVSGLSLLIVGIAHKVQKHKKKKEESKNGRN